MSHGLPLQSAPRLLQSRKVNHRVRAQQHKPQMKLRKESGQDECCGLDAGEQERNCNWVHLDTFAALGVAASCCLALSSAEGASKCEFSEITLISSMRATPRAPLLCLRQLKEYSFARSSCVCGFCRTTRD